MNRENSPLLKDDLLAKLPLSPSKNGYDEVNRAASEVDVIIVLDDDPTGTQTVYDIPVLTSWSLNEIEREILTGTSLFYLLTNSRSLTSPEAKKLSEEIGQHIHHITQTYGKKCLVISRSDSTLRGHYPAEVHALEKGLKVSGSIHFIIPAFFEGGRYTVGNIHYVQQGDYLIPAAQTPFAQDKVFGYQSSHLEDWVIEKWKGTISKDRIQSLSIAELRNGNMDQIINKIRSFTAGDVCIVNAADYEDLRTAAIAIIQANCLPLLRTAASFVAAISAKPPKALLSREEIITKGDKKGGLIVVGSYVPKTTRQLTHLLKNVPIKEIEIDVYELITGHLTDPMFFTKKIQDEILSGKSVVLYTSRELVHSDQARENLAIGNKVSQFLTEVVGHVSVRPKFVLAKGGITSSDIATQSLRVKRALVLGQMIAGVSVWKLGNESKFPGLSYIVFPGNVGDETDLTNIVTALATQ